MSYDHFRNLSCYEEFEIQCDLLGISKIDVLKEFGHQIDDYYFFISHDGFFNWFDLNGNHIEDPGILRELKEEYIPSCISKCIIPYGVTYIEVCAFENCKSLKTITIPASVTCIDTAAFYNCSLLKTITIPAGVTIIGEQVFSKCTSLKEVIFKGKTLEEVKQMENYPFGIKNESIIKYKD